MKASRSQLDPVRFGLAFGLVAVLYGWGYPLFWMWAGMRAPSLGSTGAAKETLRWLAWPSSGALMVGALLTLALVVGDLFMRRSPRT